jgi:breast cancer 2 susceptibility protein
MAPRCSQTWECKSFVSFQATAGHHRSNFRNVAELLDLSLKSALQHRFHLSIQGILSSDPVPLHLRGSVDALRDLKAIGCHLATQEWVDNHWSLILWKLAGMAALDPESEADVDRRRWSWSETMRQLQYRYAFPSIFYYVNRAPAHSYEKELNCGARPALRLIAAQDVSAGFHMILCVSGIVWSESGIGDDGLPLVPHPTLELTDGWYRLRTRVDEALARAARRGVIRVGRKIAVSGTSVRFQFSAVASRKELICVI